MAIMAKVTSASGTQGKFPHLRSLELTLDSSAPRSFLAGCMPSSA